DLRVPQPITSPHSTHTAPFLGRDRHAQALADAFEITRRGSAVLVWVHGASGMGKSILVKRFVDALSQRGDAIVLAGRCYGRESMPYKAVDSIVDALSHHLRRLKRLEADALMPREILPLARVFPVLMRVEAVAAAPRRALEIPDPQELRRRAFGALRELFARV